MLELEKTWLRETYVDLLLEYAGKNKDIVLVEADLMRAAGTLRFQESYPDQVINVGIAEANMIGVAAGLSAMGKIPFTHTFTPFATRRVCDQVTLSVVYAGLNVKMVGSDPGVTAELNGGTHMSMEDVSIMRNIPGLVVFEPTDSAQLKKAFPQILAHEGPVYMRLLRRNAVKVFDDDCTFELGKGIVMREGSDVTIFASGIETAQAIEAAERLAEEGISAEVINIHTVKPIDRELVIKSALKTKAVVTAENHSVIGGLGAAVAECLDEHKIVLERVGVKDHFGEVGSTAYLMEKYGLLASNIIDAAKKVINNK